MKNKKSNDSLFWSISIHLAHNLNMGYDPRRSRLIKHDLNQKFEHVNNDRLYRIYLLDPSQT